MLTAVMCQLYDSFYCPVPFQARRRVFSFNQTVNHSVSTSCCFALHLTFNDESFSLVFRNCYDHLSNQYPSKQRSGTVLAVCK